MTTAESQYDQDQIYETMQRQTKGKVCRVSGKPPVIVFHRDAWVATCADHRPNPCLWKKDESQKERYGAMVNHAMAVRPEQMPMSVKEIRQFISPKATEAEAYIFLRFCQAQGLNPFVNDAYLIKYDERGKAAIVIGIQALLKRAESNPNYTGYQAGVVVLREGKPLELQGSLVYQDSDVLIGGWAEVRRKDWPQSLKVSVGLKEYNKRQAQWTEKPATMIEKVALAQGLRRVFPQEVGTLFERQELETEVGEVEGITVTAPEPVQEPSPEAQGIPLYVSKNIQPEPMLMGQPTGVALPLLPSGYTENQVRQAAEAARAAKGELVNAGEVFEYAVKILGYANRQQVLAVPGVEAAMQAKKYHEVVGLLTAAKRG